MVKLGCIVGVTTAAFVCLAASSLAAAPRITSVAFANPAHPVVTIRGHGFGLRPLPDPDYHPPSLSHPLCPVKPTEAVARYGFDYGTRLYLQDSTQQPRWGAGRYRPSLGELDCLGLLIRKYTPTEIIVQFGAAYPRIPGAPAVYKLAAGDEYIVGVAGAQFTGHVHFG